MPKGYPPFDYLKTPVLVIKWYQAAGLSAMSFVKGQPIRFIHKLPDMIEKHGIRADEDDKAPGSYVGSAGDNEGFASCSDLGAHLHFCLTDFPLYNPVCPHMRPFLIRKAHNYVK